MLNNYKIAIVIPCYKGIYLKETLLSITSQTNKRFNLYIGIDDSPDPIEQIIAENYHEANIICQRFDTNLGSKSLTQAWQRCINLVQDEQYVWLFSDDDIMPSDSVERIHQITEKINTNIFRFPLQVIDQNNEILWKNPPLPLWEDAESFLISKLSGKISSAAIEYIFNKNFFYEHNGFVEFPLAWCSDDATWTKIAKREGIHLIEGEPISWRNVEGVNISNDIKFNREKLIATEKFLYWIFQEFSSYKQFSKPIYQYIKTILKVSVRKNFTTKELFRLCIAVSKFSIKYSVRLFLKFFLKGKKHY